MTSALTSSPAPGSLGGGASGGAFATESQPGGAMLSHGASRTVLGTAALASLVVSVLSGTTTTTPIAPKTNMRWVSLAGATDAIVDSARITIALNEPKKVPSDAMTVNTASAAELVHWLHGQSGLTWDQLGKMFGVSRRAVHLWANGKRMNSTNLARLNEIAALVRELPARTPEQARSRLMSVGSDGLSIIDRYRARNHDSIVNGPVFAPEQLLDAQHEDGDVRQ